MTGRHEADGAGDGDTVGSVGQETLRLLRTLGTQAAQNTQAAQGGQPDTTDEGPHSCPTGWCPICQVADFVRDHPEAVAQVATSAGALLTALRDLVDAAVTPKEDPR